MLCMITVSMRLPLGRMRRATSSVTWLSSPISTTEAMFGLRAMPAMVLKVISRSRPYCPRTNRVVIGSVPCTALQIARVTGLALSMIDTIPTQLRTPTSPFSRW